jgi:hypothetical protein
MHRQDARGRVGIDWYSSSTSNLFFMQWILELAVAVVLSFCANMPTAFGRHWRERPNESVHVATKNSCPQLAGLTVITRHGGDWMLFVWTERHVQPLAQTQPKKGDPKAAKKLTE